jgi:hypothetical protein
MESLIALSLHKALSVFGLVGAGLTFFYARDWRGLAVIIAGLGLVSFVYTIVTKRFGPWFFYDTLISSVIGPGAVCLLVFVILKAMKRR